MRAEWNFPEATVKALLWLNSAEVEETARDQIYNLMELPFACHHVAVMPDVHAGYGMPIGCVLATKNVVIPNAVGVDIGCGMLAARVILPETVKVRQHQEDLRREILARVPVGRTWHDKPFNGDYMPNLAQGMVLKKQYDQARHQLGTLGGGNHFIEVQLDEHGNVWVMIHSGSRNLGKQVCDYYNKWAKDDNAIHFSKVGPEKDLAFFHREHNGFDEYVTEMTYAVEFAKSNRAIMMRLVLLAMKKVFGESSIPTGQYSDICHNHMAIENHMGKNVCVHRKGAAGPYWNNKIGIIPGSMGSKSYLVQHTGKAISFLTTSHGAGRSMSRAKAKATLTLAEEQKKPEQLGVVHGLKNSNDLDEAPSSYKDIAEVMKNQSDLVSVVKELTPILSIKG